MTEKEIQITVAELDGWQPIGLERDAAYFTTIPLDVYHKLSEDEQFKQRTCLLPSYITSYDAILPVIKKEFWKGDLEFPTLFAEALRTIAGRVSQLQVLTATPLELSTALLKALNKWKD